MGTPKTEKTIKSIQTLCAVLFFVAVSCGQAVYAQGNSLDASINEKSSPVVMFKSPVRDESIPTMYLRPPGEQKGFPQRAASGPAKEYYDSGELKATIQHDNGRKDGPARTYFRSGALRDEVNYKNNKLDGVARKYYEDGTLYQEAFFKDGKLDGVARIYNAQGKLEGEYVYKNGKPVQTRKQTALEKPKDTPRKPNDIARNVTSPEITSQKISKSSAPPEIIPTIYLRPPGVGKKFVSPTEPAKAESPKKEEDTPKTKSRLTFEAGYEASRIIYKEPTVMRDSGNMQGVTTSLIYRRDAVPSDDFANGAWFNMYRFDFKYSQGKVNYKGRLSNGTPYNIKGIPDFMVEMRLLAGHDYPEFDPLLLTLYAGIGYRYLNDDSSFDPYSYERESNYVYVPFGVELTKLIKDVWSIGGTLEFDGLVGGWQISHLGDADPDLGDIHNEQNSGLGCKASFRLQRKGEKIDFLLEPFYRYWYIQQSENVDGWIEPRNNSTEYGIKLLTRF